MSLVQVIEDAAGSLISDHSAIVVSGLMVAGSVLAVRYLWRLMLATLDGRR